MTANLLEIDEQETADKIKSALHDLYEKTTIKVVSDKGQHFVTLAQYYFSEKGIAEKLLKISEYKQQHSFDLEKIYSWLRISDASNDIQLNECQQHGIMTCLQNKVTVITGGPGTGKTTLIKKLLHILEENHVRYKLAAPTGRAAKRITEGTGRHATTIHRLLAFDFSTMNFSHNENNALALDFLIIDEASMLDVFLAYALIRAVPQSAHILLIGDVDQLPSVGPGNVLNDLIETNRIPSVKLHEIFRQAQNSLIIVNAHRINHGEFPVSYLPEIKRDFFYIKENESENVPGHLRTIFTKRLPSFGINMHEAMVLVPMNRGAVGTQKINYDLQTILNPTPTSKKISYAGTLFKVGDRVMQIKNNYDKHIFNGDIGIIEDISMLDRNLFVRYPDNCVGYEFNELDELVLAYAISIHKSQGSEYSAVIIPIFMQHFSLLQRNLIYTAITRAKRLCIFIGQPKAIAMAIKNNKEVKRKTFLQEFLISDLTCR